MILQSLTVNTNGAKDEAKELINGGKIQ